MNIGLGELVITLVILVFILGIPAIIIFAAVLLFRRVQDLEARIAKLEDKSDSSAK